MKHYSLEKLLATNSQYNICFGERSNGKTFACLEYGLKQYRKSGKQMAIIRRWSDDFTGKRGQTMFNGLVSAGVVKKLFQNEEWTDIYYYASKWYLCKYDEDTGKRIVDETPFAYGFSISAQEHDKSTSYPDVTTIFFDEFISRTGYLPQEFVLFMSVCSTIIRQRNDVKIFMMGNTVNKYSCPYYSEMGLNHIKQMKQGTIDVYSYGENGKLKVAVEYASPTKQGKESDVYFAFDNPKLSMITGGEWEIDIYPHAPCKWLPKEIIFTYIIIFDGEVLQADIIQHEDLYFTFIHRKTTPIKDVENDIIFTPDYCAKPNYFRKITKPVNQLTDRIAEFFRNDKVFYQDNEIGEIVRNYLLFCGKNSI